MGVFLPSETGRLVLSYLLDNKYRQTQETFMTECSPISELRSLSTTQLKFASKVNNRSLTDILNEYTR